METNIRILRDSEREYGLEIRQEKSKIIQIRGTERPRTIVGFEVIEKVKYL